MSSEQAPSWGRRLSHVQATRHWIVLVVALLITVGCWPWVSQLELNSDFQAMLPESAPSVRDLDEIRARFGGTSTLTLAVQVPTHEEADIARLRTLVRDVATRLEGRADLGISAVDWNVAEFGDFVRAHQYLYADLGDLREIRDSLEARLEYERARANPFFIDLDDAEPPDPQAVIQRMRDEAARAESELSRFPEGYFQHPSEPLVFIFLRTSIRGGEGGATDRLIEGVEATFDEVSGEHPTERLGAHTSVAYEASNFRVDYGGDIMDAREETDALRESVERSTFVTIALLIVVIYLFYRRWRAIPLLCLALVAPIFVTFAFAEVTVDYLTASSGFLTSIIIGNGVNPQIIWLGRYFEERRDGREVAESIALTHVNTWEGTLAATLAAALAYGSLIVTDYRGFRDFGIIGFVGMCLCWVSCYTVLPALTAALEAWRPMTFSAEQRAHRSAYGVAFARLAFSRPNVVLALGFVTTVITFGATWHAVVGDPLEYDFRNLQADRPATSRVSTVNRWVGDTVDETQSGSAVAVLARRTSDVEHFRSALVAIRAARPDAFGAVHSVDEFLPRDQAEKIPVLARLRELLLEVRPHVSDEEKSQIDAHLPPAGVTVVGLDDLPGSITRSFRERDGTLGRLLFVEHADGESNWDGRYLIRWADAVRELRAEDGERPAIAGVAVVFADLLEAIFADGPKAVGFAFLATLVLVAFSFRTMRERALTMVSLLIGIVWMAGLAALLGMKITFLNILAFPITFGVGVDYAVNVMKRFELELLEQPDPIVALRDTIYNAGGAVVLCSLTTIIGYISLWVSTNRALNSFGGAMAISEITCVASGVVLLPAVLYVLALRNRRSAPISADGDNG